MVFATPVDYFGIKISSLGEKMTLITLENGTKICNSKTIRPYKCIELLQTSKKSWKRLYFLLQNITLGRDRDCMASPEY